MSKTDIELKQDIEAELRWDPKVNAAQIGVTVDKGAVSLLGEVDTYPEKWAAEEAVKRIGGVRAVAQDLKVKLQTTHKRSDSEIAKAAQDALEANVFVPTTVTAKIADGWVTLEGQAAWNYQRDAAEQAVRNLVGVVSVQNEIAIRPQLTAAEVKEKVRAALQRQATSDADSIHVETSGSKVTLSGTAASWRASEDATSAAWSAPGVSEVVDQVRLSP